MVLYMSPARWKKMYLNSTINFWTPQILTVFIHIDPMICPVKSFHQQTPSADLPGEGDAIASPTHRDVPCMTRTVIDNSIHASESHACAATKHMHFSRFHSHFVHVHIWKDSKAALRVYLPQTALQEATPTVALSIYYPDL